MKALSGSTCYSLQIFILFLVSQLSAQDNYGPGWYEAEAKHITLSEWKESLTNKPLPNSSSLTALAIPQYGELLSSEANISSNLQQSNHPELEELARGLKYEPIEILNHLANNYNYQPYMGLIKGPLQTYLEESGNNLDLIALATELLEISKSQNNRIGDISVVEGEVSLSEAQVAAWLGCENDESLIEFNLNKSRIPYQNNGSSFTIAHYWLKIVYDGQDFEFDPSFRSYEMISGIQLQDAIQFNLPEAETLSAGIQTEDSIAELDSVALCNYMNERASFFRNFLKSNHDNDHIDEILGGTKPTPLTYDSISLPEDISYNTLETFAFNELPSEIEGSLKIELGDQVYETNLAKIDAQQISVSYEAIEPIPGTTGTDFGTYTQGSGLIVKVINFQRTNLMSPGVIWVRATITPSDGQFALLENTGSNTLYSSFVYPVTQSSVIPITIAMNSNTESGSYSASLQINFINSSGQTVWWDTGTNVYSVTGNIVAPQASIQVNGENAGSLSNENLGNTLKLTIENPALGQTKQVITNEVQRGGLYTIVSAFGGNLTQKRMQYSQRRFEECRNEDENSLPTILSSLDVVGQHWFKTSRQFTALFNKITNTQKDFRHRIGIVGKNSEGYFVDVAGQVSAIRPKTLNSLSNIDRIQFINIYTESGLEHQSLEQLQNNQKAISTTKILNIANEDGNIIYLIDQENFDTVSPLLSGYDISSIQSIVENGQYLILPETANVTLQDWTGFGYFLRGENLAGAIIKGGLNGSFSTSGLYNQSYVGQEIQYDFLRPANTPLTLSAEPVNLENGSYFFDMTDITVGNKAEPLGISFGRRYDSDRANIERTMGNGWTHNWDSVIETFSDENAALGLRRPEDAAVQIVAAYAIAQIESLETQTAKHWLMKALIANWAVDSITNNAKSLSISGDQLVFIKHPDGSYSSPPGVTASLHETAEGYELQHRSGMIQKFEEIENKYRLTEWLDIHGNKLLVNYDGENVSSVTDHFGRSLNFSYTDGKLTQVSDDFGRNAKFGFENNNLISYETPNGFQSRFTYDDESKILSWINPEDQTIAQNIYSPLGKVITQFSEGKPEREWNFLYAENRTIEQDPTGAETIYFFDQNGLQVGFQDAERYKRSTIYNSHNNPVEIYDFNNNKTKVIYDNNQNLLETRRYLDEENFVASIFIYNEQNLMTTATDENGNETNFTYNDKRQLLTTTDPLSNITENVWNTDGTLNKTIDQSGHETVFSEYDAYQNVIRIDHPNNTFETFTFSAIGDLLTQTDTRGNIWSNTWDNNRNLLTETAPDQGIIARTYHFSDKIKTITDQEGNTTAINYNALNNEVDITNASGEKTTFEYDLRDQIISETSPLGFKNTILRDQAKRVIGNIDPLGLTTMLTLDPNGDITTTSNALNEIATNQLDALRRPFQSENPRGEITSSTFDNASNQMTFTDGQGATYEYKYDALNREIEEKTPEGRITQTFYNSRDLVERVIEPSGQETQYFYNEMGWLTEKIDDVSTTTYTYDENGNILTVSEGGQSISYEYDELNRITRYEDENGNVILYSYDLVGNLITKTYPGTQNRSISYQYNELNLLEKMTDWANNITQYFYDKDQRLIEVHLPNNTKRIQKFDSASRLVEISVTDADGFLIYKEINGYDNANKIIDSFSIPLQFDYQFSPQSNTYNLDNELVTFNNQNVISDYDGNLLSAPILEEQPFSNLNFDARNRLKSIDSISYEYGIDGERNRVNSSDETLKLIVDPNTPLSQILIQENSKGEKTYFIYGLGLSYQLSETNELHSYHYDSRGSTVAIVAEDGRTVKARYQYSPYGSIIDAESEFSTLFKYNGQFGVQTDDSGLYYMRARNYSPHLRRFINPDPIGFAGGLNWFAYANGNPISLIDPFGLGPDTSQSLGRTILGATPFIGSALDSYDSFKQGNWGQGLLHAGLALTDLAGGAGYAGKLVVKGSAKFAFNNAASKGLLTKTFNKFNGYATNRTVHKNSLDYVGETHVYRIKGPNGSTYKIGESAQGLRKSDGISIRARQQTTRLSRETGEQYTSEIRKTFSNKRAAREYETRLIKRFRRIYGNNSLPGNKINR